MRHALKLYPHTEYFWFLHEDALIMNPSVTIEEQIMKPKVLDKTMLRGQPIIPPESVITTFKHLKGEQIHLVLTQDKHGLASTSFFLRQGDWAKFLLDTWFDPLYRSYNFQRADTHALVRRLFRSAQTLANKIRNTLSSGTQRYSPVSLSFQQTHSTHTAVLEPTRLGKIQSTRRVTL